MAASGVAIVFVAWLAMQVTDETEVRQIIALSALMVIGATLVVASICLWLWRNLP